MLTIISLILILICLAVITAIIVKKLPALAILDINNMPGEKESKFKDTIIKARVERDLAKWSGFFGRIYLTVNSSIIKVLKGAQDNLKKMKLSYKIGAKIPWPEKQKRIKDLLFAVEDLVKKENFNEAEEKLVEVISIDQKNLGAFFKLGEIYEELKKYPEARQTYEYALKLAKQYRDDKEIIGDLSLQEIYFSLAWLEKEAGNFESAFFNVLEALEFEPNSPRYLDLILDLSIIRKDKESAIRYFEKLAASNPENQKLEKIKEEIEALEENL
jgi:tetratricopeptide (TPR) repeat protein